MTTERSDHSPYGMPFEGFGSGVRFVTQWVGRKGVWVTTVSDPRLMEIDQLPWGDGKTPMESIREAMACYSDHVMSLMRENTNDDR